MRNAREPNESGQKLIFTEHLPNSNEIQSLSTSALAYLGDAVYELHIRNAHLFPPKRSQSYHQQVVAHVRAETQAEYLQLLLPHLTEPELEIAKRARNNTTGCPRRLRPQIYQQATSFEALIGYLYLTNVSRLQDLFGLLPCSNTSQVETQS